jgi:uncharacterized membrane protein YkoI
LFPNTFAIYSNSTTTAANTTTSTPALLQAENNDYNDVMSDYNLTKQARIQPNKAILVATKNVSAQPSELRSLTLEKEKDHTVFSVDIFKPNSTQCVDVEVDTINGKVLRIAEHR